jgi:hypothetical protein
MHTTGNAKHAYTQAMHEVLAALYLDVPDRLRACMIVTSELIFDKSLLSSVEIYRLIVLRLSRPLLTES